MFINKNFSNDCRAMSIETLDTQCDDICPSDNDCDGILDRFDCDNTNDEIGANFKVWYCILYIKRLSL